MTTITKIIMIVAIVLIYIGLCFFLTWKSKGEEPFWLQVFCFPFDIVSAIIFLPYIIYVKVKNNKEVDETINNIKANKH